MVIFAEACFHPLRPAPERCMAYAHAACLPGDRCTIHGQVSGSLPFLVCRSGGAMRQTVSGIIFLAMKVDVKCEEPIHQIEVLYNDSLIVFIARTCFLPWPAQKYCLRRTSIFPGNYAKFSAARITTCIQIHTFRSTPFGRDTWRQKERLHRNPAPSPSSSATYQTQ